MGANQLKVCGEPWASPACLQRITRSGRVHRSKGVGVLPLSASIARQVGGWRSVRCAIGEPAPMRVLLTAVIDLDLMELTLLAQ